MVQDEQKEEVVKLSEAILLGSTVTKLMPEFYLLDGCGCLIGSAAAAMGRSMLCASREFTEFPWLQHDFEVPLLVRDYTPENYHSFWHTTTRDRATAYAIIGCMAFMVRNGTITLDQAVAWVRSVEPQEEAVEVEPAEESVEVAGLVVGEGR